MAAIHGVATITSKGQLTLPKPIRQALGVDVGGKVTFELRGAEVIVTRAEEGTHEDPAITGFLALLEKDIKNCKRVSTMPNDLARAMIEALRHPVDLYEEIDGDVTL
ncbi:MAG: AbrB family transcriptional regulator [Rhodospirillales bacterium RIFCSPLOWO2_12_FULL_58_28]|nr:MAG: AbrB family transcriptional regulator [Rhodospirillales bacterium RIFCSPLOWO2_02_FULL_58_16]OHC78380.1 MAG: AbrB family transcriptional regulator [Rhodospirillales bacterium RIFCSPLOWO2_12_FULL_58_28]